MDPPSIAAGAAQWSAFAVRAIDLASLGAAYLIVLLNILFAAAAFVASRRFLVVSPNRGAKDYALYASAVLTVLLVATALENELLPAGSGALHYAGVPHLLALLAIHVGLYRRVEPQLIAVAGAATSGAIGAIVLVGLFTDVARAAHWLTALALGLLLALLTRRSVSTKRAYVRASSIYLESKEFDVSAPPDRQVPSLGVRHWVALAGATAALSVLNATLQGAALPDVPAAAIVADALLLLGVTALVCAIPTAAYWLARRSWMPELTRFVWLVWLVVGFTFTYGNYLKHLDRI